MQPSDDQPLSIFTIGHSNHALEHLLRLLADHGIQSLVDVRSQPYSRYATHFNRADLEYAVKRQHIRYVFMGEELGGRPVGDEFYDAEEHVLYSRVAQASFFRTGIERLIDEGALYRTAILCSEENPTDCHRRLLIGRVLAGQEVVVRHIRGDGREQTEADLQPMAAAPPAQQVSLWGEPESAPPDQEATWRSVRPIPRRRAQPGAPTQGDEWGSEDF
jgi:uncharacterized protein (DUF488 family)